MSVTHPPLGLATGTLFETHVQTRDLARAMAFYGGTLGLELAHQIPERSVAFYWIGGRGNAMLGVWGVPDAAFHRAHFAFTIEEARIPAALAALREAGVSVVDFFGNPTNDPSVHAWMPACGIFFRDPDDNSLELLAMLAGDPAPALGVVPLSAWYALYAPVTSG